MNDFFKDIYTYHYHYNQKLIDLLEGSGLSIPDKVIPLLSHNLNAHHRWNVRILEIEPIVEVFEVHDLKKCRNLDKANYQQTLEIIDQFPMSQRVAYQNTKGDSFSNSVQEILFHAANHHTHHKGQIMSALRAGGIAPLVTDYIFYKR